MGPTDRKDLESSPPTKLIWNNAPWIWSNQHARKYHTGYHTFFIWRKTPLSLDSWSDKREKHHLHCFWNPTHSSINKEIDLKFPKAHGDEGIINCERFRIISHLQKQREQWSTDFNSQHIAYSITVNTFVENTVPNPSASKNC